MIGLLAPRADRVAVVDDDARVRELLKRYLSQEGFEVFVAEDARALRRLLERDTLDLIVLDWVLPGEDGLSVCKSLRQAQVATPVIMLTAKSDEVDRVVGLEVGADDFVAKPFSPRELLARIHAVLRRRPAEEAPSSPSRPGTVVSFGPFEFDMGRRRLLKRGEPVSLTSGEFAMLKVLVQHARQPLTRDKLSWLTRSKPYDPADRSLDVQIARLRKVLEELPSRPQYIQTVWSVGYVFIPDNTQPSARFRSTVDSVSTPLSPQ
jgi:two-component system phosphate regulon response regulator OmpR